jgi:hypothetical protein
MIDPSIIKAALAGVKRVKRDQSRDKELITGEFDVPIELSKLKNRTTESLLQEYSDIMNEQAKLNQ